jgi:hypothetical protein
MSEYNVNRTVKIVFEAMNSKLYDKPSSDLGNCVMLSL